MATGLVVGIVVANSQCGKVMQAYSLCKFLAPKLKGETINYLEHVKDMISLSFTPFVSSPFSVFSFLNSPFN